MDEKNSKEIQDNGNQTRSLLSSQPNASASVATSSQHQHRTPPPHNISPASHMEEEKKSVSQVVIVEDGDDEKEQVSSSCPAPQSSSQSPSPPQRQSPSTTSPNNLKSAQKNDLEDDARFVCNICLDPGKHQRPLHPNTVAVLYILTKHSSFRIGNCNVLYEAC